MKCAYYPTKHAVQVMSARDITWAEVLEVLEAPEVLYQNTQRTTHVRSNVHQRGNLFVVSAMTADFDRHDSDQSTPMFAVITVGLRQQRTWCNADVVARNRILTKEEK